MKITKLTVENLSRGCVTDNARPRVSFAFESERSDVALDRAEIEIGAHVMRTTEQSLIPYDGEPLRPFTVYPVTVTAIDDSGEVAAASTSFETGRLGTPWQAKWITDGEYKFTAKKVSPIPLVFRKSFDIAKPISRAVVYATALGVYELDVNGKKAGDRYFAPGFTSYRSTLQYQTYDVTELISGDSVELCAVVSGGWAVGSFVFTRKNRITAKRQAFLAELRLYYADGTTEVFGTDESWQVTGDGCYRAADIYDGETFDASVSDDDIPWHNAAVERIEISPNIVAEFGAPVRAHERLTPVSCVKRGDELVYDFGQNFAGVISAKLRGKRGQTVVFRHAEVLKSDGSLFTELLRSAKATATYICADGEQEYSPRLTYMGFRYVGVRGIDEDDIELSALRLYSDLPTTGEFSCSDERINKLQANIRRSAQSNLFDIPTDCPQRDERMGWTGDIALFAPTACFNFDMSRFFEKWLNDVKNEQRKSGGIPNTVPVQGYGFPATMPVMAVDFWGDACVLVPWAEYMARGDVELLRKLYPTMKKYVNACRKWAAFGVGKHRYIWNTFAMLHFGDWVAPDEPKMLGWQKRSKWTATASLCHTSAIVSKIAKLLGNDEDATRYARLSAKVADAYVSVFTDGKGRLKKEFQTAYVLPLAFGMFPESQRKAAVDNLVALVEKNDHCIGTGFPGTPFVLFALADCGRADVAFEMLENEKCPSWLYEVKAGGTTIWERWDALKADGSVNTGAEDGTGGMISFNHYASGAVGEFLYRRIAGIEPITCGYKKFKIEPIVGGGLTHAFAAVETPYGRIESSWKIENGKFMLEISVPASTECTVVLPDGASSIVGSGKRKFEVIEDRIQGTENRE